ncbi:MAG TPA: bifunctional adenosylcobinamide kinase/adenosylcobinamide-phosphate guanylyltransferase [Rhodobacteraceae bacterium]|jgi:adenosylcobinamide kinase/adenosylcobinamide-phosphate guanylyltransferase|nr:bifunctional adenosylcobinamide kinase/adenosylcobinamide-phosphate guanylyltransferase [Paracoccaceae bacterium]
MLPKLTLVIGAAASGKSAFAERLVVASGLSKIYLATAQPHDDEMRAKINLHQTSRGPNWQTIEAPLDLSFPLADATTDDIVLLDCATLWLTNHFLAESNIEQGENDLLKSLRNCAARVVIVSNEVGAGIVPDNALSRKFRQAQGQLNQVLAAKSDLVVNVISGLPLVLKGALPK